MATNHMDCEAVIFDMDGIMIDSEPFWHEAEIECFAKVGINLSKHDCEQTMGIRIGEIVEMRYKQKPWNEHSLQISKKQLSDMIVQRVIDKVLAEGEPLPGLQHALDFMQSRQPSVKLAVASSSDMVLIEAVMKRLHPMVNIYDRFSVFESAQGLKYGKPHPQVYLDAAHKLQVDPRHCLAIEDSLSGTISAKAAQMKVISVPFDFPSHSAKFRIADKVLSSLNAINEKVWQQIWPHSRSSRQSKL
mmetsp:Transcript_19268/g.30557  ORF Transcript_19268/g.30557 Transcript_19268/m.30557 type:complete len:246 (+) Transcript_19268:36-773(+)